MSCIVILGAHRSGTSLTTSILQSLGVHIGDNLLAPSSSNKKGHFENVNFYRLNMDILRSAGGNWANPPSYGRIMATKQQFAGRIVRTISQARKPLWGWKCPRSCLTIPLYLPHLRDVKFVLVYRETKDVVRSLLHRSGGTKEKWERLTKIYQESMEKYSENYPVLRVQFEDVVNKNTAQAEVEYLNAFVGGNGNTKGATRRIDFR